MKKKKSLDGLSLNKKKVSELSTSAQEKIRGGYITQWADSWICGTSIPSWGCW
ncbi:class I lanthipeptide [Flagellimonas oceanensis]|uniref:class I lanthipeptide n=1 Tax=Flagellimonas oceanensis TaxID=2499163 RepID=UPI0013E079B1|nr:class I lanthipeptide [Allomuricauda oceanensis]